MNPANVSSTGALVQANTRSGFVLATGPDLEPGDGRRAEVTIVNLGSLPASMWLLEEEARNEVGAGLLGLSIYELGPENGRRVFLGELGSLPEEGLELGRFEGGESRTYRFTVLLSSEAPVAYRSRGARAHYRWSAAAVPAAPDPAGGR